MGSEFRKQTTRPLPENSQIETVRGGRRVATCRHRPGRSCSATIATGLDGTDRISATSATYMKFRDTEVRTREETTDYQ